MSKSLILELPDDVFERVAAVARKRGVQNEKVALDLLLKNLPYHYPTNNTGSLRESFGSVSLGRPTGTDNEQIDADLAREYMNNHGDEG